jgi:anti-sigma factor RsiW
MNQISKCKHELVQAYADAELSLSEALEVERHLETCDRCSTSYRDQKALSTAIAENSLYHKAPKSLIDRLEMELAISEESSPEPVRSITRRRPETFWRALSLAASAAFLIVLGAGIITRLNLPSAEDRTIQDVVSNHIRSLMVSHLADVASTDQHTVKPWFNGKLDFSPQVQDFAADGFPLIGGRIDLVNDQPVAALVYRRNKHYINLFVWPSTTVSGPEVAASQRGYNLIHWIGSGMNYWAISDVNRGALEDFVKLSRSGR